MACQWGKLSHGAREWQIQEDSGPGRRARRPGLAPPGHSTPWRPPHRAQAFGGGAGWNRCCGTHGGGHSTSAHPRMARGHPPWHRGHLSSDVCGASACVGVDGPPFVDQESLLPEAIVVGAEEPTACALTAPRQSAPSGPARHSVPPPDAAPPWRCLVSPGSSVVQSGLDLQEVEVLLPSRPWSGGPWPLRPPSGAGSWAGPGLALGGVLGPPSPLLDQVEVNTCADGLTCLCYPDQTGTNHCCPWARAWG